MLKYVMAWWIGITGLFGFFKLGTWFIYFRVTHEGEWWGGFPLWAAGAVGGLIPLLLILIFIVYKVAHV